MANSSGVVGVLRALLTADTAQFDTSMRKAVKTTETTTTAIGGLGKEIQKLTPQAERMVKAFSGGKLFETANNLAAAIGRIGGAAKLSDASQARANKTFAQAIQVATRLGQTAPKAWMDLEKATRAVDKSTKDVQQTTAGFGGTIQGLGKQFLATFAGFFTAQAALNGLRTVFHALVDEFKLLTIGGAAVGDVSESFQRLTAEAGHVGETLLGVLRKGTHSTISDFELMKTVNQDLAAGLNLTDTQFGVLAKGAFALAQATGTDVRQAFETMNDAMLTGRTRSIAVLTGRVNLEAAEKKYAASLGASRENLTEEGKLEAARVAILDSVAAATTRLGVQTDGLDERVAQAQTFWANFQNELGKTVATSPVIEAGMLGIKDALEQTFGVDQQHLIGAIARAIDDLVIGFVDVAKAGVTAGGFIAREWIAVNKLLGNTAQIMDGVRLALLAAQQSAALGSGNLANWKKLDDQMGDLMLRMSERGKALKAEDASQAGVDKRTAEYIKRLDELKAKMETARAAALAHTEQNKASVVAVNAVAEAERRRSELLKASAAELSEQRNQIEKYGAVYKTFAEALAGVRERMNALTTEQKAQIQTGLELGLSTDEIAKRMGLASAAVDLFATTTKNARTFLEALDKTNREVTRSIYEHFRDLVGNIQQAQLAQVATIEQLQTQSAQTSNAIEFRRAEFAIEQAKRWGIGWQRVYEMERDLARKRLDASIEDARRELEERTRVIRARLAERPNFVDQRQLEAEEEAFRKHVQQMEEDFNLSQAEIVEDLKHTHDIWTRTWDNMRAFAQDAIASVADGFASMLVGARTFKEAFLDIWRSIQRGIQKILQQILDHFIHSFLQGMLDALKKSGLGKALGRIFGDILAKILHPGGGAGGGGGGGGNPWTNFALNAGAAILTQGLPGRGGGTGGGGGEGGGNPWMNLAGKALPALIPNLLGHSAPGALPSASPLISHLAPLFTNPWTLVGVGAAFAGYKLYQHFRRGPRANDIRDKDLEQFKNFDTAADKADIANPPGFHGLDRLLTKYKKHDLFGPFVSAHDPGSVRRAFAPIKDFMGTLGRTVKSYNMGGFVPPGVVQPAILHGPEWVIPQAKMGGNQAVAPAQSHATVNFNINAVDAAGVQRLVRSREFIYELRSAMKLNHHGVGGTLRYVTTGEP